MTEDEVRAVVARHTEGQLLGFLGQPRVNVLRAQPRPRRHCAQVTDRRARRARRPPDGGRDARPRMRRRTPMTGRGRPAGLPRDGARCRQDLPDARGGPPPARARHGRRGRLRRGARSPAHRSSCSTGSRSCPRRRIEYRGVVVEEMDTDAVIARTPTVALIDELAHTNVPGLGSARSAGRTSSVIRDAGIHVVSTLNVQHLESVADAVATITGAPVNERLPDDVLARRRRDRARRHEPARAAPADEARQRLPAGADPGGPREVLHRAEPDGPPRAGAAPRRAAGRGPARGHDRRPAGCPSSPSA